jgi:hypothetical protein
MKIVKPGEKSKRKARRMVISAIVVEISNFYPQDIARVKMANPAVSISLIKAKPSIREI